MWAERELATLQSGYSQETKRADEGAVQVPTQGGQKAKRLGLGRWFIAKPLPRKHAGLSFDTQKPHLKNRYSVICPKGGHPSSGETEGRTLELTSQLT